MTQRWFSVITFAAVAWGCSSGNGGDEGGAGEKSPASSGAASSECQSCTQSNCASQQSACDSASGCADAMDCLLGCDTTDGACLISCAEQGSSLSNDAQLAGSQLHQCVATSCLSECWASELSVGAGSPGGEPSAGSGGDAADSAGCQSCSETSCGSQRAACDAASGCGEVIDCVLGCSPADNACASSCAQAAAGLNVQAQQAAATYSTCLISSCTNQCFSVDLAPSTPNLPPGPDGQTPPGSQTPPDANAPGGLPSTPTPAPSTPPPSGELSSGVNWLTFDGDWADASATPNSELNISGALYAYGDSCATVEWDPATRCVSGEICEPGADYANWGMAVQFDFHNTGEEGSPPETKLTWNPAAVGATGVAWRISGAPAGLQAWITNMDPFHGGACAADTCEIEGPPDGTPSASGSDELHFASLVKDDWGGSGTNYTFDPSAILSLQFKLPAVNVGASSFAFCIDAIGIVR